jgi:hypothetical protein
MNNTKSRKRRGPEGVRGSLIPHELGLYGLRKGNGGHQVLRLRVEDNLDNLRISRDRILGLLPHLLRLRITGEMASGVIRLRMILGVRATAGVTPGLRREEMRRRVRRAMGRMGILVRMEIHGVIATIMSRVAEEEAAAVLTATRIRRMRPETIGTVAATTTMIVAADSSRMLRSGRVTKKQRKSKTLLKGIMRYTGDKTGEILVHLVR